MTQIAAQPTRDFDSELFATRIREYAERTEHDGTPVRILEAGCGRQWSLDLAGVDYHLTGVDEDEPALRLRTEKAGDLDDWVVGDLHTVALPAGGFDVVFSSFVLEHVSGAERVLDRLVDALRPGGLLLLRIPDRDSVYGFITRIAPFSLHVAYKRWVRGRKNAGKPGHGPYPTVYDPIISHTAMHRYCESRGLIVRDEYSSNFHLDFFGRLAPVVDVGLRGFAAVTGGRLTASHNNLAFVIEKPT